MTADLKTKQAFAELVEEKWAYFGRLREEVFGIIQNVYQNATPATAAQRVLRKNFMLKYCISQGNTRK